MNFRYQLYLRAYALVLSGAQLAAGDFLVTRSAENGPQPDEGEYAAIALGVRDGKSNTPPKSAADLATAVAALTP